MSDPVTLAIATAVAGKTAETMTEAARAAVTLIIRKCREKLSGRPVDLADLDAAVGESRAEPLARVLEREFTADPAFAEEIRALWRQAAPSVSNVFNGHAEKVVQLRDVHGDLTIN